MSNHYNEQLSLLKTLATLLRGGDVLTRNTYLDETGKMSKDTVLACLEMWMCVAWDTIPSDLDITTKYCTIRNWIMLFNRYPFEDVLDACRELAESLTRIRFGSLGAFKQHHKHAYSFVGELLAPLKWVGEGAVSWGNPESYRRVRTFLVFPHRINLRCAKIEDDAVNRFSENVDRVQTLFSKDDPPTQLNQYIVKWFSKADVEVLPFAHHSNGRTADIGGEDVCISKKYTCLKTDSLTRYVEKELPSNGPLSRVSKLICVPKDYRRYRTICAEPTTLMFMQQGISYSLRSALRSSSLSHHVTLEDQNPNAYLAQIGSLDGSFATIDLSDASDSVSWFLVRESFRRTPFLRYFYASRSRKIELPSKEVRDIPMFATMGNALTFPVECIIFAAIVEYALDLCDVPGVSRTYRVYGDDIVCSCGLVPTLLSILAEFGFKVNTLKTYYGPPGFRESCGGEFLLGYDVTPLRISRRFAPLSRSNRAAQFEDRVSLANRLFWAGYPMARGFLLSQMKGDFGPLFFTDDPGREDLLYSPTATNYQLPKRWNTSLSRTEYLATTIVSRLGPKVEEWRGYHLDDYRYYEWSRTKECDRILDSQIPQSWKSDESVDVVQPLVYDRPASTSLSKAWRART